MRAQLAETAHHGVAAIGLLLVGCESTFAPPIPPEVEWIEGTWQSVRTRCPFGFVSQPDGVELLELATSGDARWVVDGRTESVERFEIRRQDTLGGNRLVILFEHLFGGNVMAIKQVPPDTLVLWNPNVTDPCGHDFARPVG